jgi:hypothetical protein
MRMSPTDAEQMNYIEAFIYLFGILELLEISEHENEKCDMINHMSILLLIA